jgi:cephalosporin hydroxylase
MFDSNHTEEQVLKELKLYTNLVTKNSYCIVFDTIVIQMPDEFYKDRPWEKNNNPKRTVDKFLKETTDFVVDQEIDNRLLLSISPSGYMKRIH